MSKRQQEDLNRLEDELQNAKKAGEDTATKLKEVLFNYQIPRPHLGLANPNFNVGNSSSNNDVCNAGMNNSNNSSSSLSNNTDTIMNGAMRNNNGNTTASTPMMAMMAGGQQKEQQVGTRNYHIDKAQVVSLYCAAFDLSVFSLVFCLNSY